jgi:hypothetical protein
LFKISGGCPGSLEPGQQEKKANMSKPKNQENLCNVPKENWREVIKTNQNLPTKPVIV